MSEEKQSRFKKLEIHIGEFRRIGIRPAAMYVTLIFILGWLAIIVREYVLTFLYVITSYSIHYTKLYDKKGFPSFTTSK